MKRRGVTLIELLVVIGILMLLAAFVLPKLELNGPQRRINAAASMTSTFLGRARARAIETGRPVGVLFKHNQNTPGASTVLREVEVPKLYAGTVMGACVQIQYVPSTEQFRLRIQTGSLADGLLRPGDKIKFGMQGRWYQILPGAVPVDERGFLKFSALPDEKVRYEVWIRQWYATWITAWIEDWKITHPGQDIPLPPLPPDPPNPPLGPDGWIDDPIYLVCNLHTPQPTPWPTGQKSRIKHPIDDPDITNWPDWGPPICTWSPGLQFQIQRRPSTTISPPIVLPSGTAIDLTASGFQNVLFEIPQSITILLSPNGAIHRLYWTGPGGPTESQPTELTYLLIGQPEHIPDGATISTTPKPDAPDEEQPNWHRLESRWLGINPTTGIVVTEENAATPIWDKSQYLPEPLLLEAGIDEARSYVRQSRGMGEKKL